MPIYEYRCEKGHHFELFQSMSEDAVSACVECGAGAERVLSPPAVHFKGSGFYTTDYARKGAQKKGAGEGAADGGAKEKSSGDRGSSGKGSGDSGSSSKPSGEASSSQD